MSNPIHILWAVPRSTSTAFEWMMRQRGDLECLHEPFGEAWYQGESPLWPRLQADCVRTPGLTLQSVWQDMLARAQRKALFSKDFPHYINTIADDTLLDRCNHSFLIRDPAKTITSMFKHWPNFHPGELGFIEQRQLFDRLCDKLGQPPAVLDSDDLLQNPQKMVKAWCDAIGIEFMPQALSWEPGARDEVSWWDGGSFHANLRNSDGLKPQVRRYADLGDLPEWVREQYESVLPHYKHLYKHRLQG